MGMEWEGLSLCGEDFGLYDFWGRPQPLGSIFEHSEKQVGHGVSQDAKVDSCLIPEDSLSGDSVHTPQTYQQRRRPESCQRRKQAVKLLRAGGGHQHFKGILQFMQEQGGCALCSLSCSRIWRKLMVVVGRKHGSCQCTNKEGRLEAGLAALLQAEDKEGVEPEVFH